MSAHSVLSVNTGSSRGDCPIALNKGWSSIPQQQAFQRIVDRRSNRVVQLLAGHLDCPDPRQLRVRQSHIVKAPALTSVAVSTLRAATAPSDLRRQRVHRESRAFVKSARRKSTSPAVLRVGPLTSSSHERVHERAPSQFLCLMAGLPRRPRGKMLVEQLLAVGKRCVCCDWDAFFLCHTVAALCLGSRTSLCNH